MGELEQHMAAGQRQQNDMLRESNAKIAKGRQLVDEFVALMRRHQVPTWRIYRETYTRRTSRRLFGGEERRTTQGYAFMGEGWRLQVDYDPEFHVGKGYYVIPDVGPVWGTPSKQRESSKAVSRNAGNGKWQGVYEVVVPQEVATSQCPILLVKEDWVPKDTDYAVLADRGEQLASEAQAAIKGEARW
jgi:hypothetical protein